MKILITAFDAFGGESTNASLSVLSLLPKKIHDHHIITAIIPTVAYRSVEVIKEQIIKHQPDIVLSLGQATGRADITLEKVGINFDDFRICDNDGQQIIDKAVIENADSAYFVTLPLKAMVQAMRNNGVPASISMTAGTFVCNHLLFATSHFLANNYPHIKNGFIHIPCMPEQAATMNKATPSMSSETVLKGIISALSVIDNEEIDISLGSIC